MEAVIEASLESLSGQEVASAYRALCGMILVQTAIAFRRKPSARKDTAMETLAARKWIEGGGVISFGEACEATGMDMERVRRGLHALAEARALPAISMSNAGVYLYDPSIDRSGAGAAVRQRLDG